MALSACNKQTYAALTLIGAMVLAGCAVTPPPTSGGAQTGAVADADLGDAQRAQFERGANALRAGNAQLAADIFTDLVRLAPGAAAVYANLGTARMMQGHDDEAMAALKSAVDLNPDLATAQLRLGVLYRRAGEFKQAENAYQAALRADPENRYAHLNLGILYDVYLRQPAQALTHYERFQALSSQPDDEVAIWIADVKRRL